MPTESPTVSIIIPTYGHQHYVLETLGSVYGQTYSDYELIVINDGSPDDTASLIRPLAEAGRLRYFEQKNSGQSAARNFGLSKASGRYIAFLDDDLWPPDNLERQVTLLNNQTQAVVAYGYARSFGPEEGYRAPDSDGPQGQVKKTFLVGNYIITPSQTLIRKHSLIASAVWIHPCGRPTTGIFGSASPISVSSSSRIVKPCATVAIPTTPRKTPDATSRTA